MDSSTVAAKHLLQRGADPNGHCADGKTFLDAAVYFKDHALVHYLLVHGADVNACCRDRDGEPPLITAIRSQDEPPLQALLAAGARVNERDRHGDTALMWAILWDAPQPHGHSVVKELLSRGARVNARNLPGETALTWALQSQAGPETLRLLRSAGARA